MFIKTFLTHIISIFVSFFSINSFAQKITANEGSFGIDINNKLIVWHQTNIDSIVSAHKEINFINFKDDFSLINPKLPISHSKKIALSKNDEVYTLYITKLPLINISHKQRINDDIKVPGNLTYYFKNQYINNLTGIEHRGNISLSYPKKNYDLETWTDSITKKSKNVKFQGLRNDDDWIIDALYTEPLRIRSHLAQKLWKNIHTPHYRLVEPKSESGVESQFVEVFKNGNYLGLHTLMESVDRKLLKLKKNDGKIISGELFKASSYEGAPSFIRAPPYKNIFPHWAGFEMRYPVIDYTSHWDDLSIFVNLVVNSTDEEFTNSIAKQVVIENVIDYYLFINLLGATDNLGKNYFLAKQDKGAAYFFVAWDLDGVMGINPEGKRVPKTTDILSNGLFDRLLLINPNGYKEKVKARWEELRQTEFDTTKLLNNIDKLYLQFENEKIYEREAILWKNESNKEQCNYLKEWISDRCNFLDSHFNNL